MIHDILTKLKKTLVLMAVLLLLSCDTIGGNYGDCGVWLEFVFDYNMEYTDAFDSQVRTVDVYLFDKQGKFVQARHAAIEELEGRKRMFLDKLTLGEYKILTVGNLSDHFRFTDRTGANFIPGSTTMEQTMLALSHSGTVDQEFSHTYFGPAITVNYRADLSLYKISLIRQTNRFNVVLRPVVKPSVRVAGNSAAISHTAEIIAPEAGVYNWLNQPLVRQAMLYRPHSLVSRDDSDNPGVLPETDVKINTMRLLESEPDGYRIVIRDVVGGGEVWSNSLLPLLAATNPDKGKLPLSEYLDREGDWNIVIVYQTTGQPQPGPVDPEQAFVALKIWVNDWVVWQHDVDL